MSQSIDEMIAERNRMYESLLFWGKVQIWLSVAAVIFSCITLWLKFG